MTERKDAYWDELGIAWCAINPQSGVIAPRLRARLRRQTFVISAGIIAGSCLGIAGMLLGSFTIWAGWTTGAWNFLPRGIAIVAISGMLLSGAISLLPIRAARADRSLKEMIDLSIRRAQRALVMVRLGFCSCAIALVFGLAGAEIRTHFSGPPRLSPIVDVLLILVFALGLYLYRRHVREHLERMRALCRALAADTATA
jgi:MFS family permease